MKWRRSFWIVTGCIVVLFASCAIFAGAATSTGKKEAQKLYEKGNNLFKEGKYREAARDYEKALTLVSDFAPLYYNLAQAQTELGEYDKAISNYQEYIRLRPEGETAREARDSISKLEAKLAQSPKTMSPPMGQIPTGAVQPPGQVWRDPATGLEFVWLPAGCFQMGSPQGEQGSSDSERPVHEVCLNGFWMGKTEVTVHAFRQFVDATGYKTDAEKAGWAMALKAGKWERGTGLSWRKTDMDQTSDTHPVINVSWNDAKTMAEWLSRQGNGKFDLPSEAQWEYGCRSGARSARFWGESPDDACIYGNVRDETARKKFPTWENLHRCQDGYVFTAPVGTFRPSGFGLFDMLGNVNEWCDDSFSETAYANYLPNQPIGLGGGDRVMRGGGWFNVPGDVRCGKRSGFDPGNYSFDLGFRLVRISAAPSTAPSMGGGGSRQAALGKEIFSKNCSRCHPGGGAGIGPSLKKTNLDDFKVKVKARHSSGTMPQFSQMQLTDEQLDDVVAYIRTLQGAAPVQGDAGRSVAPSPSQASSIPPASQTQTQLVESGKDIFNKNCSRCHPGGGAGIGPSLKKTNFLDFNMKFKARHSSGTMPQFSTMQLTDEQLDAVVAYINTLKGK